VTFEDYVTTYDTHCEQRIYHKQIKYLCMHCEHSQEEERQKAC
jgi:hypothetical protein